MKNQSHAKPKLNKRALAISRSITIIINVSISTGILFLAAGRNDWLFGWLYIFSYLIFQLLSMRVSLGYVQLEEHPQKQSLWGRILDAGYSLTHPLTLILAGLEFNLTQNPFALGVTFQSITYTFLLLIFALMIWTHAENPRYFSRNTGLQQGKEIIRTGPYQYIRHPGYAGLFMLALARPFVLGSLLGLIPGAIGALLILVRTIQEDQVLQKTSADYKQYSQDVRHRMFSGIW